MIKKFDNRSPPMLCTSKFWHKNPANALQIKILTDARKCSAHQILGLPLVQTSSLLISEHFISPIQKYLHARLKAERILWSNGAGIAWATWDENRLEMIESQIWNTTQPEQSNIKRTLSKQTSKPSVHLRTSSEVWSFYSLLNWIDIILR